MIAKYRRKLRIQELIAPARFEMPYKESIEGREYWMVNRGPGFLVVVWFDSFQSPLLSSPVSKLVGRHTGRQRKRDNLLTGESGGGAQSYDWKKAWSSINYSVLSERRHTHNTTDLWDTVVARMKSVENGRFKGTVSRDFLLLVFLMNQFPPSPRVLH